MAIIDGLDQHFSDIPERKRVEQENCEHGDQIVIYQ